MAADHACALIRDPERGWLLERRDAEARHAPGGLTCFGGRRERHEETRACLVRELEEELGWRIDLPGCEPAVRFEIGRRHVADFFLVPPAETDPRCRIPGRAALWVPDPLAREDLSRWHRAVLEAHLAGRALCRIEGDTESTEKG